LGALDKTEALNLREVALVLPPCISLAHTGRIAVQGSEGIDETHGGLTSELSHAGSMR
jgi:hypothetical protein